MSMIDEYEKHKNELWIKKHGNDLVEAIEMLENSSSENPLTLIKMIEKEARGEFGVGPEDFFSNPNFAHRLVTIGYKYQSDEAVLENVISTLWHIAERCNVKTQKVYDFLLSHLYSTNKRIKRFVMYSIPFFPQFDQYELMWEYILSMPKVPPKDYSMSTFYFAIECRVDNIPNNLKGKIINILEDYMKKSNMENIDIDGYEKHLHLITKLRMQ